MPNGPPAPSSDRLTQLAQLVTQLGFPLVVAGLLLWFLLTRVDTAMKNIQVQEEARTQKMAEMQAALLTALEQQTTRFERAINDAAKSRQ